MVDAVSNRDLESIGAACADLPLAGGFGIALGLPENFRRRGLLWQHAAAGTLPPSGGARAVIAGSCSPATQRQVALMREQAPAFHVDPLALARGTDVVAAALVWAAGHVGHAPLLVFATATPETVKAVQAELGVERARSSRPRLALVGVSSQPSSSRTPRFPLLPAPLDGRGRVQCHGLAPTAGCPDRTIIHQA